MYGRGISNDDENVAAKDQGKNDSKSRAKIRYRCVRVFKPSVRLCAARVLMTVDSEVVDDLDMSQRIVDGLSRKKGKAGWRRCLAVIKRHARLSMLVRFWMVLLRQLPSCLLHLPSIGTEAASAHCKCFTTIGTRTGQQDPPSYFQLGGI